VVIATGPVSLGSRQTYKVTGLSQGTQYYFRIWTRDEAGNWSQASWPLEAITPMPLPGTLIRQGAPNEPYMAQGWYGTSRGLARSADGKLHAVYTRGTPTNVYYAYSTNSGASWTEEPVTAKAGEDSQWDPVIAIDSANNVHVAWDGTGWGAHPTFYTIQYRKRTGTGWQAQESVADIADDQYSPVLAIDSADNVHFAWDGYGWGGNPASDSIVYRMRTASTWQTTETVASYNAPNLSPYVTMALDTASNIHLAWNGTDRNTTSDIANIQYRKRLSTGWQPQEVVTSYSAGRTERRRSRWTAPTKSTWCGITRIPTRRSGTGEGQYPHGIPSSRSRRSLKSSTVFLPSPWTAAITSMSSGLKITRTLGTIAFGRCVAEPGADHDDLQLAMARPDALGSAPDGRQRQAESSEDRLRL